MAYVHRVHFYETDKMGITHHSNYIRWMEEARVDYLEKIGWAYDKMEKMGIASPVIEIHCEYKANSGFTDRIEIEISVIEYKGVRLGIGYTMRNADTGTVVAIGRSRHCFLNENGKPIMFKKEYPELDKILLGELEKNS